MGRGLGSPTHALLCSYRMGLAPAVPGMAVCMLGWWHGGAWCGTWHGWGWGWVVSHVEWQGAWHGVWHGTMPLGPCVQWGQIMEGAQVQCWG